MALTLTEAAKFSRNMLKKGVIEEIIKDSVVLQKLPFIDVMAMPMSIWSSSPLLVFVLRSERGLDREHW
jgi:hypothetical protein